MIEQNPEHQYLFPIDRWVLKIEQVTYAMIEFIKDNDDIWIPPLTSRPPTYGQKRMIFFKKEEDLMLFMMKFIFNIGGER